MKILFFYTIFGDHAQHGEQLIERKKIISSDNHERYEKYFIPAISGCARDLKGCEWVMGLIAQFEFEREPLLIEGEQVDARLSNEGVQIDIPIHEDWIDDPEGRFTVAEFKAAILGWQKFLQLPKSLDSSVEIELPEK